MPGRSAGAGYAVGAGTLLCLAPLPFIGDLRENVFLYVSLAVAGTFVLYAGTYLLERNNVRLRPRTILLIALAMRVVVFPLKPSLSDDAWRYLWDGRLVANGISPYDHVPADSALDSFHDEWFLLQGYPETNTIYPPVAQLVFAASVGLAAPFDSGPTPAYYVYKLLLLAGELLALWLLIRVLQRLRLPLRHAVLYAWHPLVVVELAGQGHTDAFWVLAVGLALFAYVAGSPGRGLGWLGFGVGVRLFPVLSIPLWCRFLSRRQIVTGLLLSIPFLALLHVFLDPTAFHNYATVAKRFTNFYEFNGGAYQAVKGVLDRLHIAPSNRIAGLVITSAMGLGVAVATFLPLRKRTLSTLIGRLLAIVTLHIALTAKVHVWYFVLPLYLLALKPGSRLGKAWLWASFAAPMTYLFYVAEPYRERTWVLLVEWIGFAGLVLWEVTWRLIQRERPARH